MSSAPLMFDTHSPSKREAAAARIAAHEAACSAGTRSSYLPSHFTTTTLPVRATGLEISTAAADRAIDFALLSCHHSHRLGL